MAERIVKHIRKSLFGEIIALCNPQEPWSPRQKQDAIQDIESNEHSYHVPWGAIKLEIKVAEDANGKYLFADDKDNVGKFADNMRLN